MLTIPIYDTVLLPDVTFYFRKEVIDNWEVDDLEVGEQLIFAFLRNDIDRDNITMNDIFPIGVFAKIEAVDSEMNVKIHTYDRVNILSLDKDRDGTYISETEVRPEINDMDPDERRAMFDELKNAFLKFVSAYQWGLWARGAILQWKNLNEMISATAGYYNITWEEKYQVLEADSVRERYELIENIVYEFFEIVDVANGAELKQKEQNESLYREDAIKKQIEILQKELDEMHPESISDVRKFEKKIEESGMNEEAYNEAVKVLNRMKQEGQNSHEYGMLYDYLDFVTALNWKPAEQAEIDLKKAEEILDRDHYGLKKVKQRIVQQLAVMALNPMQAGSILLFVGAPGTGKTSIGQSIAEALGRKYVRVSLGGIRDEAEIRGHRRTYIGAMPGRIMEGIKRSGASNPVVVLDEVDKLASDFAGDPASALLEVLDPEQNGTFTDHYMNVPYDLSKVFFVCTANTIDTIPEPLLNRMEVIDFQGYTANDKLSIAKKHLIPKALKSMGIKKRQLNITDTAIKKIISNYTMEAGVRGLKKRIDSVCRYAAVKLVKGDEDKISVTPAMLKEFLGSKGIQHDVIEKNTPAGIVTGLAWTASGGEILFIETKIFKGTGKVIITGQLGDVMKESVEIAVSLVKTMYPKLAEQLDANHDLHIHVPEGATPKDGPSAGITLVTALVSLLMKKKVNPAIGMTGEVSLRGNVMPIGGLPEKLMAAERSGVRKVFIPEKNREDLEEVPEEVKERLEIIPVKKITEVLDGCGLQG